MTKFIGQLYLDSDGVLADFDKTANAYLGMPTREYEKLFGADAFWAKLAEIEDFFFSLDLMPDAQELYDAVKHLDPIILTGAPSQLGERAHLEKIRWAEKKFGPKQRIITCSSKNKYTYCKPGDIIVDDWPKHRKLWEDAGGIWVPHTSTKETIAHLINLGVLDG